MNQFKIRGIDYTDDSLQHGLGKGSGRGRPKGSKNGQVMPGAAYMKGYTIVGEKAEGDANLPGASNTGRLNVAAKAAQRNARTAARPVAAPKTTKTTTTKVVSTTKSQPTASVQKGAAAVQKMMGTTGVNEGRQLLGSDGKPVQNNQQQAQQPAQQNSQGAEDLSKEWPWSAKRVNAAGGLQAREGRQIVYDNPTLNEDYKKHIAKFYGDSDGRSYPKALEKTEQPASQGQVVQTQDTRPENERTSFAKQMEAKNAAAAQQPTGLAAQAARSMLNPAGVPAPAPAPTQAPAEPLTKAPEPKELNNRPGMLSQVQNAAQQAVADGRNVTPAVGQSQQQQTLQAVNEEQEKLQAGRMNETPEQKSLWDSIGGWFSQAGKDIANTAVGAWDATNKAVSDATNWVKEKLGGSGDWVSTAYNDVSDWVGDRVKDLDRLWNGRDVEVNDNGRWRQGHEAGLREQLGGAANAVGNWIGGAANDVGGALNTLWNGRDVEVNDNGRWRQGHEAGLREQLGGAANAVGNWIGGAANDVARTADQFWNGRDVYTQVADPNNPGVTRDVQSHAPGLREQIENGANAIGQTVGNYIYGVKPGEGMPYYDVATGQYHDGTMPSLGERIQGGLDSAGQALNNAWQTVSGAANNAGQAIGNTANNVWKTVSGAANDAGKAIGDTANNVWQAASGAANNLGQTIGNAWNGTDTNFLGIPTGHTPGIRENIVNGLNQAGQAIADTASNIGQAVGNAWNTVTGQQQQENPLVTLWNTPVFNPNALNNPFGESIFNPQLGQNLSNAWNHITGQQPQQGNWLQDNVVTPVSNAANGAVDFVRNTANGAVDAANNLGQTIGNAWNGTDTNFLGIPTGHKPGIRENIANGLNQAGQAIGNAATGAVDAVRGAGQAAVDTVRTVADATSLAANAYRAGVPAEDVNYWAGLLASGQVTPDQYTQYLNGQINTRQQNAANQTRGWDW